MTSPCDRSNVQHQCNALGSARAICTVLAVLAATGLGYRLWRASTVGAVELLTAAGTAVLVVGALGTGWAVHVRKVRAEQQAEREAWDAARLRRQENLLDGEEDRALWGSVSALGSDEDTCAFGINVAVLAQYRQAWRQQAG
ncbi:hypothetical protein ABZ749_00875 [Micromonospora sp. NPDC047753]|uniref:hypothetical protein n=1 Tax=Micromonospora sp. NPDC047753 TaxID=3154817 RepID=UPI0033D4ACF2